MIVENEESHLEAEVTDYKIGQKGDIRILFYIWATEKPLIKIGNMKEGE